MADTEPAFGPRERSFALREHFEDMRQDLRVDSVAVSAILFYRDLELDLRITPKKP
jgi:hypothetical protein